MKQAWHTVSPSIGRYELTTPPIPLLVNVAKLTERFICKRCMGVGSKNNQPHKKSEIYRISKTGLSRRYHKKVIICNSIFWLPTGILQISGILHLIISSDRREVDEGWIYIAQKIIIWYPGIFPWYLIMEFRFTTSLWFLGDILILGISGNLQIEITSRTRLEIQRWISRKCDLRGYLSEFCQKSNFLWGCTIM